MDETGALPRLAHHSTSVTKQGNDLSSVSWFHSLHCFSFSSPHTQPFTVSSLISLYSTPPPPAQLFSSLLLLLCLLRFSFMQYGIISHLHSVSFLLCISSSPMLMHSTFSLSWISLCAPLPQVRTPHPTTPTTASPPSSTMATYDYLWAELTLCLRNLSLGQEINYSNT